MRSVALVWAGIAVCTVGLIAVRTGTPLGGWLSTRLVVYAAIAVIAGFVSLARRVRGKRTPTATFGQQAPFGQQAAFGQQAPFGQAAAPTYGWPSEQSTWGTPGAPAAPAQPARAAHPSSSTPIPSSMYEGRS